MASWGDILAELRVQQQQNPQVAPFDAVRRRHLARIQQLTGRPTVLYATAWTGNAGVDPSLLSIVPEDMHGFLEVLTGINGPTLDIIVHSPGGSAEAAEALVSFIRSRFTDVRVIIPHAAMSAATMFAFSASRLVMGTHSFLGPIDPQFILQTEVGRIPVPAHAILEQFEQAKRECANPQLLAAWMPMLRQYGPALIVQCQLAQDLARSLVGDWLARYMFAHIADPADRAARAATVANHFANHANFKSHGRFVDRAAAKALNVVVDDLETDAALEDAVMSAFHATTHTFNGTGAVKLVENHAGRAFIKTSRQVVMQQQVPVPAQPPAPPAPPPQAPQAPPAQQPQAPQQPPQAGGP
jgi:hypothetical protein